MSTQEIWPLFNAVLNLLAFTWLSFGIFAIKKQSKDVELHKFFMIGAFVISTIFLISYLNYHYQFPSKKFSGTGVIRTIYFFILITHICLSAIIVPLVLTTIFYGLKNRLEKHKKWAYITFPIWTYISITGVMIYIFNYVIFK